LGVYGFYFFKIFLFLGGKDLIFLLFFTFILGGFFFLFLLFSSFFFLFLFWGELFFFLFYSLFFLFLLLFFFYIFFIEDRGAMPKPEDPSPESGRLYERRYE